MVEPVPSQTSCTYQLERLLRDPDFLKTIDLVTKEVMHAWNVSNQVARGFVLSTTSEPEALACVYAAWFAAKTRGESPGRAKVMIRRRVIELLREDARQPMRGSEHDRGLGAGGGTQA